MSYNPKILIVDDEPQICDSLNILLSRQGYDITTVQSGKKALEILKDNQFDLLLLDMVIPDLSGFEIMDHCNGFIQKPFGIAELSQGIRNILD